MGNSSAATRTIFIDRWRTSLPREAGTPVNPFWWHFKIVLATNWRPVHGLRIPRATNAKQARETPSVHHPSEAKDLHRSIRRATATRQMPTTAESASGGQANRNMSRAWSDDVCIAAEPMQSSSQRTLPLNSKDVRIFNALMDMHCTLVSAA